MDDGRSAIGGYLIDFLTHLQNTADHREGFMLFYEAWRPIRDDTIENLESLLEGLKTGEFVCEVGGAVGSAGGAAAGIANFVQIVRSLWNPILGIFVAAAHGLKAGFAAGKAVAVLTARERTSTLIDRDYNETYGLVNLGLEFDGVLREMRETVGNIRRMSLEYTLEQLHEVVGSITFPVQGVNPALPQREIAQALVQAARNIDEADMENVGEILGRFFENNPDVALERRGAVQVGFDLVGLTRLMRVPIIRNPFGGADLCFQHLYVAASGVSIVADMSDLAESIHRLATGGSVTQRMVQSVIERLKQERSWLEIVHRELSR